MRIYISGPITGVQNFETAFRKAAGKISRHGHEYVDPSHLDGYIPNATHDFYIHLAFATLPQCDAIYLLRGWENSAGAQQELLYAKAHNLTIYEEDKYGESVPELPTRRP